MYRWICSSLMCSALLLFVLSCTSQEEGVEPEMAEVEAVDAPQSQETEMEVIVPKTMAEKQAGSQVGKGKEVKIRIPQEAIVQASVKEFEDDAFPPTISDSSWHANAWQQDDCLRCHETGVGKAPEIVHRGMSPILKTAKCRTCHVEIPGELPHWASKEKAKSKIAEDSGFASFAFPPSIPASKSHQKAWVKDDCRLCHDNGISGAPPIIHQRIPTIALRSKCRTCHVQVRVLDAVR